MIINTKFTVTIFLYTVCILLTVLGLKLGLLGFAVFVATLALLLLINSPKKLLLVFWILTIFAPSMEAMVSKTGTQVLEHTFGLLMLGLILGMLAINKKIISNDTAYINKVIIVLIAISGISAFVNMVPVVAIGVFVLLYFKPFWMFYFSIAYLKPENSKAVFIVFLLTGAVQILANILIPFGLNPVPFILDRALVDFAVGTLGDCSYVAYFMCACLFLLISHHKKVHTLPGKMILYAGILMAVIQLMFTYSLHVYPLLLVTLAIYFLICFKPKPIHILSSIIAFVLISACLFLAIKYDPFDFSSRIISWHSIEYEFRRFLYGPKVMAYKEVFIHSSRFVRFPLIGAGPGNYTSFAAFFMERPMTFLPHLRHPLEAVMMDEKTLGSVIRIPFTGLMTFWGELGPVGFIAYWGLCLHSIKRVRANILQRKYTNPYHDSLARAFVCLMILYLILNVLRDTATVMPFTLGVWILAGLVWNSNNPNKDEANQITDPDVLDTSTDTNNEQ